MIVPGVPQVWAGDAVWAASALQESDTRHSPQLHTVPLPAPLTAPAKPHPLALAATERLAGKKSTGFCQPSRLILVLIMATVFKCAQIKIVHKSGQSLVNSTQCRALQIDAFQDCKHMQKMRKRSNQAM